MYFEPLAHILGVVGEAMNLWGAYLLAKDILEREGELRQRPALEELASWLRERNISVHAEDLDLSQPGATALVLVRRTVQIGKRGLIWLKCGFSCLVIYHLLILLEKWISS